MSERKQSLIGKIVEKVKSIKHIEIVFAVIVVVVMLAIYFSTFSSPNKSASASENKNDNYCERIRGELESAIGAMCGGTAKVVINWESGVESLIAYATGNGTSTPQLVSDGGVTKPIVLKEIYPKAIGVIIICKGGNEVKLRLNIINAVSALLDITPDKINVYAINN